MEDDDINYDDQEEVYSDHDMDEDKIIGDGYEILTMDYMDKEREKKIEEFIQISNLPKSEAELVLMNNNWNIDILSEIWYDQTQKIKENSGITQTKESNKLLKDFLKNNKVEKGICPVCEIDIDPGEDISLGCGHVFCSDCFKEHLKEKTNDQLTLLGTKCPMRNCNYQVPSEIFKKLFKDDKMELNIYNKCLMRNFTESNADIKLCPNPRCDKIIKLPGHGMNEIKCPCGTIFCFKCLRDSHRPCDCFMVDLWEKKSTKQGDSENLKWLIANTKQCPSCKKFIEKNQGCNHMTCRREAGGCGYEFCWICLGEWAPHGTSWYECKRVNPNKLAQEKKKIDDLKRELDKRGKYEEGVKEEETAIKFGKKLNETIDLYKRLLLEKKGQSEMDIAFLDEALKAIIECHLLLKNTYIFGYYMKKQKNDSLYEHQQEMLRREADLLHEKLEMKYLQDILAISDINQFKTEFIKYKENVQKLMSTALKFKDNILEDVEKHPEYIDYKSIQNSD